LLLHLSADGRENLKNSQRFNAELAQIARLTRRTGVALTAPDIFMATISISAEDRTNGNLDPAKFMENWNNLAARLSEHPDVVLSANDRFLLLLHLSADGRENLKDKERFYERACDYHLIG